MISLFGEKNPTYLAALIEICFNSNADNAHYTLIDQGIVNDDLSPEQYRVLPLLFNSKIDNFSELSRSKIESSYKHTLYRNHILLNRAQKFQRLIIESQLGHCVFLKGIAQSLRSPGGIGTRPMADVDVLVPYLDRHPQKFLTAINQENYKVIGSGIRSITLLSPEGFQFDIHWYLSEWSISQDVVNSIVNHSQLIIFRNQTYSIPCHEHHLSHIIGHGLLNPALAFDARWVIDALSIIKDSPSLDPLKIIEFSNLFNTRSRLKLGFRLIAEETPESLNLDRELFRYVAGNIKSDTLVSGWLFEQLPCPSSQMTLEKISRSSYLKNILIGNLYAPFLLWKKNRRPMFYGISLTRGFPPPPTQKVIALLAQKLALRILFIAFNYRPKRNTCQTLSIGVKKSQQE